MDSSGPRGPTFRSRRTMTDRLSMSFIVTSEESVVRQANDHTPLDFGTKLLYRAGDSVLALMYGLGPQPPQETHEGAYRTFAFERFGEVPYTLRAIDVLSVRGHYPESIALVRGLVESFVQLRYFAKYPDRLRQHLLATNAKGRVRFVTMFDEFSPGFYPKIYGQLLSGIAHSGMGLSALLPVEPATNDQPAKSLGRYGCEFNAGHAALVVNITSAILHGFLVHFSTFFPVATPSEETIVEYKGLADVLAKFVDYTVKGEMLSLFVQLSA